MPFPIIWTVNRNRCASLPRAPIQSWGLPTARLRRSIRWRRVWRARPALQRFLEECKCGGLAEADLATTEKKGIATGFFVQHPLTGQNIEVWIANYVLMRVGEGAVMGVPAHDARDFAFAQKYGLPIKPVIEVNGQAYSAARWNDGYAESGLCIQSGKYDGLSSAEAIKAVGADLKA